MQKEIIAMQKAPLKKSIFIKTILLFVIVVSPLYFLIFVISGQSRQLLMDYYSSSVQKQVSSYFSLLQQDLDRIEAMRTDLARDMDLMRIMQYSQEDFDYNTGYSINRTLDKMEGIAASSPNIEKITVIYPRLMRSLVVTQNTSYYHEIQSVRELPQLADYEILGNLYFRNNTFSLINPSYMKDYYENGTYLLEIQLSMDHLLQTLNSYNVVEEGCGMVHIHGKDDLLYLPRHQAYADALNAYFRNGPELQPMQTLSLLGEPHQLILQDFPAMGITYLQAIPIRQATRALDRSVTWYTVSTVLAVLGCFLYSLAVYVMLKKPMDVLVSAFHKVENENFQLIQADSFTGEFQYVFLSFNHMVHRIQDLIDVVYRQQLLNEKARLRQLQAQINPHFLYNSFYILRNWIKKGRYENAEQFCQMLSQYFNYLNQNYYNYGTLAQEVLHCQLYAKIQAIRFEPRIKIQFDELDHRYDNVVVPRLILQPLLENAFKYSLSEVEENGILQVSFRYYPKFIDVIVEDSGYPGMDVQAHLEKIHTIFQKSGSPSEASALLNIQQRIHLFTSAPECGLTFSVSELGGLKVTLTLLIEQEKQDDECSDC